VVIPPKDPNPKPSQGGDKVTGKDYNDMHENLFPGGIVNVGDLLRGITGGSGYERLAVGTAGRAVISSGGKPNYALHGRSAHALGYFTTFDLTLSPQFTPLGDLSLSTTPNAVMSSVGYTVPSSRILYLVPLYFGNLRTNDSADRSVDFWWEVDRDDGNGFVQVSGIVRIYVGVGLPRVPMAVGVPFRGIDDLIFWFQGISGPTPGLGDGQIYARCMAQVVEVGGAAIASGRYAQFVSILRD